MKQYINRLNIIYRFRDIFIESIIISLIIMLVDRFNIFTVSYVNNFLFVIIFLSISICLNYISISNFKKIKARNINELDKIVYMYFFVFLLLLIYVLFFDYKYYKVVLLILSFLIHFIIFIIRIINTNIKIDYNANVLDLKTICEKEIDLKDYDEMVLIEEAEVSYDLLNRGFIINQLYNTLIRIKPSKSFTIGLNGKWGSGKTTIIKNVLSRLEKKGELLNFVIIRFNPWLYNDEKIMLKSFLKEILRKVDYNMFALNNNEMIDEILDSIFDSKINPILKYIYNEIKKLNKNPKLENMVNDYLKSNNKKMIIIIDNLDRVDGEKALFLINCLDSVLNFQNTINILLYDEEIINDVLKEKFNFNERYMEKLVQLKIDIPIVDKYTMNNLKTTISNNLVYNRKRVIEFVADEDYDFDNLRELKRYTNSIISLTLDTKDELNSKDNATLRYIQLKCPSLFYEIWKNKNYYILYDRKYDPEIYTWDYKELNNNAKNYFEKLYKQEEYRDYIKYAERLFPNMKRAKEYNTEIFSTYVNEEEYSDSVLNNRIFNTRYFDIYFTNESNDFTRLKRDVNNTLNLINIKSDWFVDFEQLIKSYSPDELKVYFEILYLCIDKINIEKYSDLIVGLIKIQSYLKSRIIFGELDSIQRVYVIISQLLSKISKKEFDNISNHFNDDYKKLSLISNIKYWIDSNKKKNITYNFNFDKLYKDMCFKIIKDKINIYDEKHYYRGNVWVLYHYDTTKTKTKIKKYLKEVVNKDNVFLLLGDLISTSNGTNGYGYFIRKENIINLVPDLDIDILIKKHTKQLTEKEEFIKQVYEFYKLDNKSGEEGIYKDEYIEI